MKRRKPSEKLYDIFNIVCPVYYNWWPSYWPRIPSTYNITFLLSKLRRVSLPQFTVKVVHFQLWASVERITKGENITVNGGDGLLSQTYCLFSDIICQSFLILPLHFFVLHPLKESAIFPKALDDEFGGGWFDAQLPGRLSDGLRLSKDKINQTLSELK